MSSTLRASIAAFCLGLFGLSASAESVLWVSDDVTREIYQIELDGTLISSFSSTVATTGAPFRIFPSDVAIDPTNNSVWVVTERPVRLINYNTSGSQIGLIDRDLLEAFGVVGAEGVAIDPRDGTIWIIDEAVEPRVNHFAWDGDTLTQLDSFLVAEFEPLGTSPQGIAIDPADGSLWIIDNRREVIYNVTTSGELLRTVAASTYSTLANPNGQSVTVDTTNGTLWVTERSGQNQPSMIYNLAVEADGSAQVLNSIATANFNPLVSNTSGVAFQDLSFSSESIFNTGFDDGPEAFTYSDDPFATDNPVYADGNFESDAGFIGGGLNVLLGGIDNRNINGMSGGWTRTFELAAAQSLSLSFRYNLTQSSNYEPNEFSEVRASVNGFPIIVDGEDYIAQVTGDGSGGDPITTGWVQVVIDLGVFSSGSHQITLGGFNNRKTFNDEVTLVRFDDVSLITTPITGEDEVISEADFNDTDGGFNYETDTFRNTDNPTYARGDFTPNAGFTGGSLRVRLGLIDSDDIFGMSGGWSQTFSVDRVRRVQVTFRYRLRQFANYESDEFSEALVSFNGELVGGDSNDGILARITGDGNGGSTQSTGWVLETIDLGFLSPGTTHTVTIGAYNNQKTFRDEGTELRIDDFIITGN